MIKASKIILLVLMLTTLVAFLSYSINATYHTDKFMTGVPVYVLTFIAILLVIFYGINSIRNPNHQYAYLNFLIVSLVPNMFLIWVTVKCIQNYRTELLPILITAVLVVITYLTNIVVYGRSQLSR